MINDYYKNNITFPLINEIEKYVEGILDNNIPKILYSPYIDFYISSFTIGR